MEISEAELEAAIADTTGMPEPDREALLNLIEKGLAVDSGTFEPMSPVPPITTIFMTLPFH
jgi:hypothetical protein